MADTVALKLAVTGLWHLGCVTAACCARHFQVTGLDSDPRVVDELNQGKPPLFEPGLETLLQAGLQSGRLRFTTQPADACAGTDLLWCTYDTPVDDQDRSDIQAVLEPLRTCLPHLRQDSFVLISSQLPVGTCRRLEQEYPGLRWACSPENLRLGRAIESFTQADRVVIGLRPGTDRSLLERLFEPFTRQILWMGTESAEMVKHGLNSFLALSVAFINELSRLCERTGADAREVAAGIKSDPRIGPHAYLRPGAAFAGGTLARDVVSLARVGEGFQEPMHLIQAIQRSNNHHRSWIMERLTTRLSTLRGARIALLGLTYTPNTSTLRRSLAIDLAGKLVQAGASVHAYDPVVKALPAELAGITLASDPASAIGHAHALVLGTEWPEFLEYDWPSLLAQADRPLVVDPNGYLEKPLQNIPKVEHLCVGRTA